MRLIDNLLPRNEQEERSAWPASYGFQQFVDWFTFQSSQYGLAGSTATFAPAHFKGYIEQIHQRSPTVSSAAVSRALLMSQMRFVWRNNFASNTPGRMYGSSALAPLERPGSMTRSNFLFSQEIDVSYSGNAYPVLKNGRLFKLRPDWTTIVMGSDSDPVGDDLLPPSDVKVIGLLYQPENEGRTGRLEVFRPGEFAHWMPEPDALFPWRGASWVSSLVRQVALDDQVTTHQSKFFEHAATPNMVFTMDPSKTPEQVKAYAQLVNENHAGAMNSYKNMFLGGGTDVKVVGSTLDQLGLAEVQGGFENRVAQRSRVPATVLHIAEGNKGSALNASTYGQTRREWSDLWFTPTADGLCEALESVVPPADDSELSWDPTRVLFLQEDQKDAADIAATNAAALRQLWDGGADPQSAIEAIATGDFTKLQHTGKLSVQLQPPGTRNDDGGQDEGTEE